MHRAVAAHASLVMRRGLRVRAAYVCRRCVDCTKPRNGGADVHSDAPWWYVACSVCASLLRGSREAAHVLVEDAQLCWQCSSATLRIRGPTSIRRRCSTTLTCTAQANGVPHCETSSCGQLSQCLSSFQTRCTMLIADSLFSETEPHHAAVRVCSSECSQPHAVLTSLAGADQLRLR